MSLHPFTRVAAAFLLAGGLLAAAAGSAAAGPFITDSQPIGQSTSTTVIIRGVAGDSFNIAYTDAGGVARTKVVTVTVTNFPQRTTVPAGKGTNITITNTTQPGEPPSTEKSLAFNPPAQQAVTALAMNPGSTFNAFGQAFNLGGSFVTVATNYDIDPVSPGYGSLSGHIPSSFFDVFAEIGGNRIDFDLDPPAAPFSLNIASVLDADVPDTGIAVPFTQALSGTLSFMGSTIPFVGALAGTVTFFADNLETIAGSIVLDGIGSGQFSATGRTAVPEPSAMLLLATAAMLLGTGVAMRRGFCEVDPIRETTDVGS